MKKYTRRSSEPDVTLSSGLQQGLLCSVVLRRNRSASVQPNASVRHGSELWPIRGPLL